jgi:hypothetical protein
VAGSSGADKYLLGLALKAGQADVKADVAEVLRPVKALLEKLVAQSLQNAA